MGAMMSLFNENVYPPQKNGNDVKAKGGVNYSSANSPELITIYNH